MTTTQPPQPENLPENEDVSMTGSAKDKKKKVPPSLFFQSKVPSTKRRSHQIIRQGIFSTATPTNSPSEPVAASKKTSPSSSRTSPKYDFTRPNQVSASSTPETTNSPESVGEPASFPPSPTSADRTKFSPTKPDKARLNELPSSPPITPGWPKTPRTPLPAAKEVVVESTTLVFRLCLDVIALGLYLLGIPWQILWWAIYILEDIVTTTYSTVSKVVNWGVKLADRFAGSTVDTVEDVFWKFWKAIISQFNRPLFSPVKNLFRFIRNKSKSAIRWLYNLLAGLNFGTLIILLSLGAGAASFLAILSAVSNASPGISDVACRHPSFCLPPYDISRITSHLPHKHEETHLDHVVEVANVLLEVNDGYEELLNLSQQAHHLEKVFHDGYHATLASSDRDTIAKNKQLVSAFQKLQYDLRRLHDIKIIHLPWNPLLEKVVEELTDLEKKAERLGAGNCRGNLIGVDIKSLISKIQITLGNQILTCAELQEKINAKVDALKKIQMSMDEVIEVCRKNHHIIIELRHQDWNSFTTRVWRRSNPKGSSDSFQGRKIAEQAQHERDLESLWQFRSSVQKFGNLLGTQAVILQNVLDKHRKLREEQTSLQVYAGPVSENLEKLGELISSVQRLEENLRKARAELRKP